MVDVVTVYCKMPHGFQMQLQEPFTASEAQPGGGFKNVKAWRRIGFPVIINGNASAFGMMRKDVNGDFVDNIGGYAKTLVEKEFWDKWYEQNKDMQMLQGPTPLVYAEVNRANGDAKAKERKEVRSGLEPMTPTLTDGGGKIYQTDPRAPRNATVAQSERAA
jgi:hypothetical protein